MTNHSSIELLGKEVVRLCLSSSTTEKIILSTPAWIQVIKGDKKVTSSGRNFILSTSNVLFIPQGNHIEINNLPDSKENQYIIIYLFQELLDNFSREIGEGIVRVSDRPMLLENTVISYLLKTLPPFIEKQTTISSGIVKNKLFELLYLMNDLEVSKQPATNSITAHPLLSLSDIDITQDISLELLASKTGLSISTFKREFRKVFKQSVKNWFIRKRLEKAKDLVAVSNKSIKEIAYECGFNNPSYFNKQFKRYYAVTPKDLR